MDALEVWACKLLRALGCVKFTAVPWLTGAEIKMGTDRVTLLGPVIATTLMPVEMFLPETVSPISIPLTEATLSVVPVDCVLTLVLKLPGCTNATTSLAERLLKLVLLAELVMDV